MLRHASTVAACRRLLLPLQSEHPPPPPRPGLTLPPSLAVGLECGAPPPPTRRYGPDTRGLQVHPDRGTAAEAAPPVHRFTAHCLSRCSIQPFADLQASSSGAYLQQQRKRHAGSAWHTERHTGQYPPQHRQGRQRRGHFTHVHGHAGLQENGVADTWAREGTRQSVARAVRRGRDNRLRARHCAGQPRHGGRGAKRRRRMQTLDRSDTTDLGLAGPPPHQKAGVSTA